MTDASAPPRRADAGKGFPMPGGARLQGRATGSRLALLLAGLSGGRTRLTGLAQGEDLVALARAMRGLGALVRRENESWIVDGTGNGCLLQPEAPLDLSGDPVSAALVMGLVAGYDFPVSLLVGAPSLRLSQPLAQPLRSIGAEITEEGDACLSIRGPRVAAPVEHRLREPSDILTAALLLAGLNAPGTTSVVRPDPGGDGVEKLLKAFGAGLILETTATGERVLRLEGQGALKGVADLALPDLLPSSEAE